jgi:serine/threonine protein kinase
MKNKIQNYFYVSYYLYLYILNKMYKNKMYKNKGGKVIGSGGFGCVFDPPLKCLNSRKREKNKISKLMIEKYAVSEFEEITNIKEKLETIPNYEDYFLLNDINICKPDKLTKNDLVHFKDECKALPKNDITKENINNSLDQLMLLNMPHGGIPIDDYIYDNGSFNKIHTLNLRLIDLLNNGIIPMNKKNIYHSDIKDSNVLVKDENNVIKTRLIDWGLCVEYEKNDNEPFPRTWRNRPLQFNVPFSVILFTDDFVEKYTSYLEKHRDLDHEDLRPFIIDYIHYWIEKRGAGHYKFINEIMTMLFGHEINSISGEEKDKVIESQFTMTYITNYLIEVVENYTRFREDGTLNMREYLNEVFIKIVDIWGFICLYIPLLDLLNNNYARLNNNLLAMFELLKSILIKYLYSPRIVPIEIEDLLKDLNELNKLIMNEMSGSARGIVRKSKKSKNRKTLRHTKINFSRPKRMKNKKLFMITMKKTRKIKRDSKK